MSSRIKLAIVVALVFIAIWWLRSDRASNPDKKFLAHLDAICGIADRHVEKPKRGVQKMFRYLGKNSPDMLEQFGAALVAIERIRDDQKHDERARRFRKRLERQAERCERPMGQFWTAVEADPEASRIAERGFERFGRTIDILLGSRGGSLPLDLPAVLRRP